MALTSSIHRVIQQGADQLITEHYTDTMGEIHVWTYSASLNADTAALLIGHSTQIAENLAMQELEGLING